MTQPATTPPRIVTVGDLVTEAGLACRCHEAFVGRGLEDPQCPAHDVEWLIKELGLDMTMPVPKVPVQAKDPATMTDDYKKARGVVGGTEPAEDVIRRIRGG